MSYTPRKKTAIHKKAEVIFLFLVGLGLGSCNCFNPHSVLSTEIYFFTLARTICS
jgi:hypothetical protein